MMKKTVDYKSLRGFNYTQSDAWNDRDFWERYDHAIVDRDMGYAERLKLNSARIFLPYTVYRADPDKFLANVKDFVQTAWKHGVSTNPIVYFGAFFFPIEEEFERLPGETLRPLSKTIRTPESWKIGEEYFDRLYEACLIAFKKLARVLDRLARNIHTRDFGVIGKDELAVRVSFGTVVVRGV